MSPPVPGSTASSGTSGSATATVSGAGFSAHNLTISNDFDEAANADKPGHQAVALNLASDRAVLTNVRPGMPAYHEETFGPVAAVIREISLR